MDGGSNNRNNNNNKLGVWDEQIHTTIYKIDK